MKRAIQTLNEVIQESDFYDFERFEDSRLCEVSHSYMDWIGRNKYSELVEPHCLRDLWKRDPYHTRTLSGTCPADIEIALRGFLSDLNSVYQEGCLPVIVSHGRTLLILEALLENKINRAGTYTGDKPTGMQNAEIRVDRLIFPKNYSSIKLLDQD
jgi:broad specificity phosphatase PhoE